MKDAYGIKEMDLFCRALIVGWRLLPDYWAGMHMLLDYFAEKIATHDIALVPTDTLGSIKEVALKKIRHNNNTCGPVMCRQAKYVFIRHICADQTNHAMLFQRYIA
jgi:hypothetical protein